MWFIWNYYKLVEWCKCTGLGTLQCSWWKATKDDTVDNAKAQEVEYIVRFGTVARGSSRRVSWEVISPYTLQVLRNTLKCHLKVFRLSALKKLSRIQHDGLQDEASYSDKDYHHSLAHHMVRGVVVRSLLLLLAIYYQLTRAFIDEEKQFHF